MRKLHTHQLKAFYLMPFKYLCASMLFLLFSSHLFAADILMGQYEFTTGADQLKATSVTQGITMGDIDVVTSTSITSSFEGDAIKTTNWGQYMSIASGKCINLSITKGSNASEFNVNKIVITLKRDAANKIQINFGAGVNTTTSKMFAGTGTFGGTTYAPSSFTESTNNGAVLVPPVTTTTPQFFSIGTMYNGTSAAEIVYIDKIEVWGTVTTTPAAPTITSITPNDTQLSVAFTAGSDGNSAITNYEYSTDGGSSWITRSPAATTSPLVISGLTNSTAYNVQLRALNAIGPGTATATTVGTTYLFYEDFANYDATATTSTTLATLPVMSNNVSLSRVAGWTGTFLYQYKAGSPNLATVCLGSTATDSAYITTPAMDLSQPFTLTFKARSLSNGTDGRFNVYLDGTQLIYSGTDNDIALTQYTTPAFVGTATSKLTFTGRKVAGNEIIIDGIIVNKTTCSSCDLTLTKDATLTISENKTYTNLSLAPGAKLTLGAGTLTVTNGITLESSALGTATIVDNNNTTPQAITGTVQQYLTAERNWYTASPVTSGTAAGLSLGTSVQSYSESAKGWSILTGSDALVAGKGYVSVATTGTGNSGTFSFNGTFNTGTIAVPVTRSGVDKAGFNLVANPYPSYLDWSLVTADPLNANIGTTMWFRTKTAGNLYTFSTYNSAGNVAAANSATTTITKFIPPMQAFWIRVNSGTATTNLTFKNTMRAHKDDNGNTLKAPRLDNQLLVRLQVSNGTNSDETVVYFNSNAQNSFDTYDSQKMFNNNALQPEIYTMAGSEQLVINGMSEVVNNTEIPLGFSTGTANNFTLATTELKNLNGTRVILKDKLNPTTETELSEGVAYNFSSQITTPTNDRFSLLFRAPGITTGIENTTKLNAQVFVNAANQITIIAPEKSNYAIYNAVGQLIENGTLNSGLQTTNSKLQTGIFVVKVGNQSNRVIIK